MQKDTIIIRQEQPKDYAAVEMLTREAFWNVYCPGCSEHYLAHVMRTHKDFIPELTFVAATPETAWRHSPSGRSPCIRIISAGGSASASWHIPLRLRRRWAILPS